MRNKADPEKAISWIGGPATLQATTRRRSNARTTNTYKILKVTVGMDGLLFRMK